MSYLVLARKYRPQTFDHVIRQEHIIQTLSHAISSDRVAHAILFSGPRGTGKTTVARILAKAMNCKDGPTKNPCGLCRSCHEIASGNSVDVFEIDGASNNSVDQIRELRENIKYMPAHSLYKIYIIDEVHMLSIAAFNALLKSLEEPPPHIMFVFATTEPHKVPITILSRCQRHDFRLLDIESITKHMESLCAKENIDISAESLGLIAREACGSMRDALSLLDQVMACAEESLTHDQVLDILGVIDRKIIFDISETVLQGSIPKLLDIIDETYGRGHDMKKLYSDLMEHFRNLLVVKMGKKVNKLVNLPAHEINLMRNQVEKVEPIFLNQILDLLFKEEAPIKYSSQPKLALEMVFIKLFQIKPAMPIDRLIEKIDDLRKNLSEKNGTEISESQADYGHTENKHEPFSGGNDPQETFDQLTAASELKGRPFETTSDSKETISTLWKDLLNIISKKHPSLSAILQNTTLKKITEQKLEIEVGGNDYNINRIKRNKNIAIIKKLCEDSFGKPMEIIITTDKNRNDENRLTKNQTGRLKQEALSHQLVTDAIEIFNGKVVEVKLLQEVSE